MERMCGDYTIHMVSRSTSHYSWRRSLALVSITRSLRRHKLQARRPAKPRSRLGRKRYSSLTYTTSQLLRRMRAFRKPTILQNSVRIQISNTALPHKLCAAIGNIDATIKAIYHQKNFLQSTSNIVPNTVIGIILDRTSFYAEAGGQEFDTGNIVIDGVADFEVNNVQVFNGYVLHIGQLKYGQFSVGDTVVSSYDEVSPQYLF